MYSQKDTDLCLLQSQHSTHLLCRQADPQHQTYSILDKINFVPLSDGHHDTLDRSVTKQGKTTQGMFHSTPALLGLTSTKDIIFASLKCCRLRGKLDLLHTLCDVKLAH